MKTLALVSAIALSGFALAGCGSESSPAARHDGSIVTGGTAAKTASDAGAGTETGTGTGGTGGTTPVGGSASHSPGTGGSVIVATGGSTSSGGKGGGGGEGGAAGSSARDAGLTADGGDGPVDAGVESGDAGGAVACESELGGICSTMAKACAVCPDGRYVHPTSAGCAEDLWCCTKTPPTSNPCTSEGGVCIANGASCPLGWSKVQTSCGGDTNPICCQPRDGCGPYPKACVEAGGVCAPARWSSCPAGTEIHALGNQLGCGGWCCVDAPPSTCADGVDGHRGMCVPGECTGCFTKVSEANLTCEAGRSCCVDICN